MAALSWNFQAFLVLWTAEVGTPGLPPEHGFDPARPYRTDGCSYVKPQMCAGVQEIQALTSRLAAEDPTGRPALRFGWQSGGEFAVESATGRFAHLAGGSALASSLAESSTPDAALRVSFALFAPSLADADGDGVANAVDRCPATADGAQADSDGDGAGDACDDCQNVTNQDQRDSNGDGFGNACDADLNDDGIVNFADLARMKAVFFKNDADADLNGDGSVNFVDLAMLKQRFFQAPGSSALTP
jgi:predicted flap endonuclease-1-like 5' DNA nuclease